ncbi:dual-specificity protein phosphatase [Chloropicon primus]|uniref:Dual-specificity protein phosphatase n=2 Tax=Chloropicon primus TaxID=1764295 RepID=A0A5B8MPI6_9CHLO|nr:dual-specificity protein phosphatase [Chloropicon primus]UPR01459.1 dual-specificity protein phosphatase [Chloropicon primus]|eukprot:QDZ22241.1 dual-specificity protein phosphatase [Chloropicon primus]
MLATRGSARTVVATACRQGSQRPARTRRFPMHRALSDEREAVNPHSQQEHEANERRRQEAVEQNGGEEPEDFVGLNDWRWTLNWDEITPNIWCGACPRVPRDVETIKERTGCTAILCLQSHACFEALGIDHPRIRAKGGDVGVKVVHVPIRDFDHGNQAEMIPEAVRVLSLLLKTGHKVYVHCTAGINRATLTVLSYLTFVEGRSLDESYDFIKKKRPQAHPYLDCWWTARSRFLQGRSEEIESKSRELYEQRINSCEPGTTGEDWFKAETLLIQDTYKNKWEVDRSLAEAWTANTKDVEEMYQNELEQTRLEANTLKQELNVVLRDAWVELQRKERLETEMKSVNKQMSAMKSAFEVLHSNLSRSCETMGSEEEASAEEASVPEDRPPRTGGGDSFA